jgi:hypothetical protein
VSSNFLHTEHIVPLCRSPDPNLPQHQDTITHDVNLSLTLLKMGKICPKHVELILEINKFLLLHLVGFTIFIQIHLLANYRVPITHIFRYPLHLSSYHQQMHLLANYRVPITHIFRYPLHSSTNFSWNSIYFIKLLYFTNLCFPHTSKNNLLIYLLAAVGLSPSGSNTVQYSTVQYSTHLHTNNIQNNTINNKDNELT